MPEVLNRARKNRSTEETVEAEIHGVVSWFARFSDTSDTADWQGVSAEGISLDRPTLG